jgi:hypothetical protein
MKRSPFCGIGPSRLLKVSSGGTYFIFSVEDFAKQDSLLYYSLALKMDWRALPESAAIFRTSVRTSQETHYISATEINQLMWFGETVAVYCENHTEHRYSPYLTGNTLCLRCRDQPLNAV